MRSYQQQMPDIMKLRSIGLSDYMIDLILKAGTINPGTPGTNTGPNEKPLIAKIGTAKADSYGWVDGATILSHPKLKDRGALVVIDHMVLNSEDLGDGDPFCTKNLPDSFATSSQPLQDGQTVIIIIT